MINISAIVSPVHVVLGRSMIGKPSLYEHNLTCYLQTVFFLKMDIHFFPRVWEE